MIANPNDSTTNGALINSRINYHNVGITIDLLLIHYTASDSMLGSRDNGTTVEHPCLNMHAAQIILINHSSIIDQLLFNRASIRKVDFPCRAACRHPTPGPHKALQLLTDLLTDHDARIAGKCNLTAGRSTLWPLSNNKLLHAPFPLRIACPDSEVVEDDGGGDSNIERSRTGAILWNVYKGTALALLVVR
jgi:hypothetical protein